MHRTGCHTLTSAAGPAARLANGESCRHRPGPRLRRSCARGAREDQGLNSRQVSGSAPIAAAPNPSRSSCRSRRRRPGSTDHADHVARGVLGRRAIPGRSYEEYLAEKLAIEASPELKPKSTSRTCTDCKLVKAMTEFVPIKACKLGWYGRSRVCRARRQRERDHSSPEIRAAEITRASKTQRLRQATGKQ
jgi:hypothetical protein